jgi:hypothetical protein
MLTPSDVEEKIDRIIALNFTPLKAAATIILYEEVLREIAKGSIDPKSLAIAALKGR